MKSININVRIVRDHKYAYIIEGETYVKNVMVIIFVSINM